MQNLLSAFSGILSPITAVLNQGLGKITSILPRILSKIRQKATEFLQMLLRKPSKKSDYVSIGKIFVSKRMFVFLLVGFIAGLTLFVNVVFPWMEGKLWTVDLYMQSEKYSGFSGKARVHDVSGTVVFEGALSQGKAEGYGIQYSTKGELVYKGDFKENAYSGQGEKYENGVMVYKGGFSNNAYQGEGSQYNENGVLSYSGNFENGERSGKGTEYNTETGNKIYVGDFAQDKRSGEGKEYLPNGKTMIYEGGFSEGLYGGNGKKYTDEKLEYNGEFAEGVFSGNGTMYDLDSGAVLYKGEFSEGKYNGKGTLFDIKNGVKLYVGNFENGKRSGEGTAYDILGTVKYSGNFRDDNIDYVGVLGKKEEEVLKAFGKASYSAVDGAEKFITYSSLGVCMVFGVDSSSDSKKDDSKKNGESPEYVLSKIIMTLKDMPYGIRPDSTPEQIQEKLGKKNFSVVDFTLTDTYRKAFSRIGLTTLGNVSTIPSVKYLMGDDASYFIRLYYAPDKSKIEAMEISPTS